MNNHITHEAVLGGSTLSQSEGNPQTRFIETHDEIQADVLLTNTCAIRENAEQKVWNRLRALRAHDRNFPLSSLEDTTSDNMNDLTKTFKEHRKQRLPKQMANGKKKRIIGVLGCMAERLKEDMFKDGTVDVVVGPDAYRDLPRLISVLTSPSVSSDGKSPSSRANALPTERAVNVQLSLEETYASIAPIRSNPNDVSAFVSIMRGCNNMCSYCVVPFTRGRERSREMESVVEETKRLLNDEGIKEVILLGQNVNSYHDVRGERVRGKMAIGSDSSTYETSNDGFSNLFRLRYGDGYRFADLLEAVSDISPELRIRFTSPHPKDYPPPLLSLMAERNNICKHLHMPAQSGSSAVLKRMRRGYSREAYLELINDVKVMIPDVAISSDFITGFCGETEEEHIETLSLMRTVQYDQAFMFAYSMREKTHAHRTMSDDIPPDVKNRRLNEIISCFRQNVQIRNEEVEIGKLRLVLVEGEAKSSTAEIRMWSGRTDQNKRVVFANEDCFTEEEVLRFLSSNNVCVEDTELDSFLNDDVANEGNLKTRVELSRGDFAVVRITEVRGHTLKGNTLWRGSMRGFEKAMNMKGIREEAEVLVKL
jgi:MiaB/RimO family radical SAM methylthiotransferase